MAGNTPRFGRIDCCIPEWKRTSRAGSERPWIDGLLPPVFIEAVCPIGQVADGVYFVTASLAGSIPEEAVARLRQYHQQLRTLKDGDAFHHDRKVFSDLETWLHKHQGNRFLEAPPVARCIMDALTHRRDKGEWDVFEYVVMPNHLHLLFRPVKTPLKEAMETFKHHTGRQCNRLLGRSGERFWQREGFDRWSRSSNEDGRIRQYIRANPVKAGLVQDYRNWPYGSWATQG